MWCSTSPIAREQAGQSASECRGGQIVYKTSGGYDSLLCYDSLLGCDGWTTIASNTRPRVMATKSTYCGGKQDTHHASQ